jgi:hypothetical protein
LGNFLLKILQELFIFNQDKTTDAFKAYMAIIKASKRSRKDEALLDLIDT